jgi:DNA helicase-4
MPAVRIHVLTGKERGEDAAAKILDEICGIENGREVEVLILGRYRHDQPRSLPDLKRTFTGMKITYMTAHASKGLEADYTIIMNVISGSHGFPCEIQDDPILKLVLASEERYPNAEERRLFYVAVTRSKKLTYVVTDETKMSAFVEEILGGDSRGAYEGLVSSNGYDLRKSRSNRVKCPVCRSGSLRLRKGNFQSFWGCSDYPGCTARFETCSKCGQGAMIKRKGRFRCSNAGCDATARICPQCSEGMLIGKNGKYGPFVGCTNWRPNGSGCSYTERP